MMAKYVNYIVYVSYTCIMISYINIYTVYYIICYKNDGAKEDMYYMICHMLQEVIIQIMKEMINYTLMGIYCQLLKKNKNNSSLPIITSTNPTKFQSTWQGPGRVKRLHISHCKFVESLEVPSDCAENTVGGGVKRRKLMKQKKTLINSVG